MTDDESSSEPDVSPSSKSPSESSESPMPGGYPRAQAEPRHKTVSRLRRVPSDRTKGAVSPKLTVTLSAGESTD